MLKKFRSIFSLLLIFGFSATLLGNEWANYYFPDKLGSYWVYEDQDGNELTRTAIEAEEIDGETYRAFNYDPELADWKDYEYYVRPGFYHVGEEWVSFFVGEDVENATEAVLTKQLDEGLVVLEQQMAGQLPPGVTVDFQHTIESKAQDYFYLFPTPAAFNEEWTAMQIEVTVTLNLDIQGAPIEVPEELKNLTSTVTVVETGNVTGTETVETAAGTFEACLKIEFQTETTTDVGVPEEVKQQLPEQQSDESFTTVWLAPNVGIVKFEHKHEHSDEVRNLELTKYEIKSDESENGDSD